MHFKGKHPKLVPYGETNLGMPLDLIDGLIVPNDKFFVRSNGETPNIDPADWSLRVTGHVEDELTISFSDLMAMPTTQEVSFLECTGNGRSRFEPEAEGTPWLNDAAGNAEWTGAPLHHVLDRAGISPHAVDVVSQGADLDDMRRGLPVQVALDSHTLLATKMNGEPLPAANGGPVRLLVPGWAGIASTKWLVELEVIDHPFVGPYQGDLYTVYDEDGTPVAPIREMPVKSIIVTPSDGAQIENEPTTITGYAWSGFAGIQRVEVSVDSGESWTDADITASAGPRSWVRWETIWNPTSEETTIQARATDERGFQQPITARWNQKGYLMNAIHAITVSVG